MEPGPGHTLIHLSRVGGDGEYGLNFYIWLPGQAELMSRVFSFCVLTSLLPHTGNLPMSSGWWPLWQPADKSPLRQGGRWAAGSRTHLGLLLMQLYLDVCELGPEVFVGSLKGDNERLGLLALISPFLGHYSSLNGVCWC